MEIVRTNRYLKDIKRLNATKSEVGALEAMIAQNPLAGNVIPGLQGIRKIRFAFGGRGKRGGGRAIYFLQVSEELVIMLNAYSKNERDDLTSDQKRLALAILKEFDHD
jgi:hypothetical protein